MKNRPRKIGSGYPKGRPRKICTTVPQPPSSRADVVWAYMAAVIAAWPHSYIGLQNINQEEIRCVPDQGACVSYIQAPDEYTESRLCYEGLSEEAQYVVNLVLETPLEAVDFITTPIQERITKSRLGKYLRGLGWPSDTVQGAFKELATYTRGMGNED